MALDVSTATDDELQILSAVLYSEAEKAYDEWDEVGLGELLEDLYQRVAKEKLQRKGIYAEKGG